MAGEKEREGTKGARSRRKRMVYSNLLPPGEGGGGGGHEETQPLFRSVLNMVHGPVFTVEEGELVPITGKWDEPLIISP